MCRLYAAPSAQSSRRDAVLDSKFFSKSETASLLTETLDEVEFDNYIVNVEYASKVHDNGVTSGPPRVKRFKPPSQGVPSGNVASPCPPPAPVLSCHRPRIESEHGHSDTTAVYQVAHAELDDIWSLGGKDDAALSASARIVKEPHNLFPEREVKLPNYKGTEYPISVFSEVRGSVYGSCTEISSPGKRSQSWGSCNDSDTPLVNFCDDIVQDVLTDGVHTNSVSQARSPDHREGESHSCNNRTVVLDDDW